MSDPADICAEAPSDVAPSSADRHLAMLDRLAEAGLQIAIALEAEAKSAASAPADRPVDLEAVALSYSRVARAVRMSLLLHAHLVQGGEVRAQAQAKTTAERPPPQPVDPEWAREEVARDRVARIVRRVIQAEHDDEERVERLADEAVERLEDLDCYGAVTARPMSEMVADICHDLGLSPDWTRLAIEAWAVEEMSSGDVGEPLETFALARALAQSGRGGADSPASPHFGHPAFLDANPGASP